MRTYYIIVALLAAVFIGSVASAQPNRVVQQQEPYITIQFRGGIAADSFFRVPVKDTSIYFPSVAFDKRGSIVLRPQDSVIYYYTGKNWKPIGSGGVVNWAQIEGKPSVFPTNIANVAGLPQTYARIDSLNAKDQRTNARIDALPTKSGDSLTKRLRSNTQNAEYHMARMTSITDSFASFKFTVGPNEYDIKEYDDSTAILVYDGQNFSSMIRVKFDKNTGRPIFTPRTPQQTIDGIWNTPQGDSILAWKGNPYINYRGEEAKDEDQAHYSTLLIPKKSKRIYVYSYHFSTGTKVRSGKDFAEIQSDSGRIIGRFNDFHAFEENDGTYIGVSHHFDFPNRAQDIVVSRATNPEGPWVVVGFLPINSSTTAANPGFIQGADPEGHVAGNLKYLMRTSNRLNDSGKASIPSSKSIQEWEITQDNRIRLKGKLMHLNGPYVSNPVYFKRESTGDEFLVYSQANAIYATNAISFPNVEAAFAQTGRLVFSKLTDNTKLDYPRDYNNQLQIIPGAGREIVSNYPYVKLGSGIIGDSAKALSISSGIATLRGLLNYKYCQSKQFTFDIRPRALPAPGTRSYVHTQICDSPSVNRSRISFYINPASQFVVQYDYKDGTSKSAAIPVQVGVRTQITFNDVTGTPQYLGNELGTANPDMVDPFTADGTTPYLYTLFNTQTDSIPALGQFYGDIFGIVETRFNTSDYTVVMQNADVTPSNRKIVVDAGNFGAVTLNMPIDLGYGEAFTNSANDLYYIQLASGPSVTLPQVESYPGSGVPLVLNQPGQTVQLSYRPVAGYRIVSNSVAPPSGYTGTHAGGNYQNGVLKTATGESYTTEVRVKQIVDSMSRILIAEALDAAADTNNYEPEALVFIDSLKKTGTPLNYMQRTALNYLIKAEKDSGVRGVIKAEWPALGSTASSHSWNSINPARFRLTYQGMVGHDSTGFILTGGSFVNTGYIVQNEGHNTSHSFGMTYYSRTNNVDNTYDFVNSPVNGDPAGAEAMIVSFNGTTLYTAALGQPRTAPNTISSGAFAFALTGGQYTAYRGTTQLISSAGPANGVSTATQQLRIEGSKNCAIFRVLDGATPAQLQTLNRIDQIYNTMLNRQVP